MVGKTQQCRTPGEWMELDLVGLGWDCVRPRQDMGGWFGSVGIVMRQKHGRVVGLGGLRDG